LRPKPLPFPGHNNPYIGGVDLAIAGSVNFIINKK